MKQSQPIKKVYADFHGLRYTRELDGQLGQWKFHGTALGSKVKQRSVNWNADFIDEKGQHQISCYTYPTAGMQSQSDRDYIEYQILLAKAAGIDGFMMEWGFPDHHSDVELQLVLEVAKQHQFEIGINWCDAWHFYNWIEQVHPSIRTREDKVEQFKHSIQYLLDRVYSSDVGATYDGHPLIFLFGGGITTEEFAGVKEMSFQLPEGLKEPWFFGRAPIIGSIDEEISSQVVYEFENNSWYNGSVKLDGSFGWIPTRVRTGFNVPTFEHWDRYATRQDAVDYLEKLRLANKEKADQFKLRISSVNPEMDNRACASWGKHDLSHIPREAGAVYEAMWQYNCQHREEIDIVFVVTWNDFTEMTHIEPTIEDGDREIQTTLKYANHFKGLFHESVDLSLPLQLLQLRKTLHRYTAAGYKGVGEIAMLDEIAFLISSGNYNIAAQEIVQLTTCFADLEKQLHVERHTVAEELLENDDNIIVSLSQRLSERLSQYYFDGWMKFEYYDDTEDSFQIHSNRKVDKTLWADFSIICDIQKEGTSTWRQGKVKIAKANCFPKSDVGTVVQFLLKGQARIRNIQFMFEIFDWK